ncbi:nuclear transport factor 2 family protein [Actinoplanes sp. TRM 88003]|uniref:Nuclear transport factor 2 family protein n=1 Tax=Paractinoplanes aksuensis TaxID=2939490 RepID=A0ABT1DUL3_9ACTN|nr:nuclear transport factor 2 family protein [Actinoplanes aksuensis]MCO8273726.1 nuclear transport factor 2 family protein [Actinoplanes aksuensis]
MTDVDPGELERRRLAALVAADSALLDDLHSDDFILVNPGGGEWDKAFYLGGIADGSIDYRRFEPVTPLQVMADAGVAVVKYRSAIEIAVGGGPYESLNAWHLDCYRRDEHAHQWRCVWSQATRSND